MNEKPPGRIVMICDSDETKEACVSMLKRVSSLLSAYATFAEAMDSVDEDAPNFMNEFAAPFERFTRTLVSLYPMGPQQFYSDIAAMGNFVVK